MSEDIRRRAVRAIGASSVSSWLAKLISLLSTLVLVRLLAPEDFGLMAMATTVTGLIGFFNEVGIGAAIVQREALRDEELDGCFGISLLASGLLSAVTLLSSWPAAWYFDMPKLQPVIAVLGFGFLFGGLDTIPGSLLRRELRMQAVLWSGAVSVIIQSVVAIPLAAMGFGTWALVASFFIGQTVNTVWVWRVVSWRPSWPLRMRHGKGLFTYGLNITYTRVLWHVYMNADKLIIGKFLAERAVGIYDVGKSLASLPTSQISGVVTSIASPVFARVQADIPKLQSVLLRFTRGISYATFPALAGMALVAPDLVMVMLGPKWTEAVLPLQALCISEIFRTVASLQSQLLISTGNVSRLVRYSTLCAVVLPVSIGFGAWLDGLRGVSMAWAIVYPILAMWLLREATIVSRMSVRDFWRAVRQPAYGTAVMAAAVVGVSNAIAPFAWPSLVNLICEVATGSLTYLAYVVIFDREGLLEIRQVLSDFGIPDSKLDRWPLKQRGKD